MQGQGPTDVYNMNQNPNNNAGNPNQSGNPYISSMQQANNASHAFTSPSYPGVNPYMQSEQQQPSVHNPNYTEKLYDTKNDLEHGSLDSPAEIHKMMRMGFIKKVYGILTLQLLLTISFMSLAFIESFNQYLKTNLALFWVALGLSIFILIPLICFRKVARTVPTNYILLFAWTLCESYMLATAVAATDPQIVMLAGVGTLAITFSLTLYACTTKTDFTYCGGILFCLASMLLVWGIFNIIFGFRGNTVYCLLGLVVYSFYLIYDTQLIMGKFGSEYSIDDYIFAALTIYLDIINLFLYLLQLLSKK